MPLSEITLAEAFQEAGHATFFAGKWHLGPTEEFWPEHQGFDVNQGGWRAVGPFQAGKYFSPYANPRLEDGPEGEWKFIERLEDGRAHRSITFETISVKPET
jgi:arylsulfatase A-like enzyme